jgi:hypothetical protein
LLKRASASAIDKIERILVNPPLAAVQAAGIFVALVLVLARCHARSYFTNGENNGQNQLYFAAERI